ncbi:MULTISPECIES: helix-turn-helix domain-containing protein [unclassified Streptomyces]|uniref:AraC-like ligand-binding domain-containing protein n=1 Tax=unclassified Streptomyces TaxID=2593676 RepID=UPI00168A5CC5|nr:MULTISPECIES: helix-turn-helix domain-containing protein [unclassified Streptomyces]MBD3005162.1 helix-turn-helix domain-containing protein [Streptomyces sp. 5-10]
MLERVFDCQDLPVADRVEAWRDITASALIPNEFIIDRAVEFRASLEAADLGGAQVTALTYASMESRRTPRLIRQSDPEMYAVGLIHRGHQVIHQERCEASLGAGDLVVYSTSHPYAAVVDARQGTAASVVVQIPRAMVPLSSHHVDRVMAARLSGREGVGGLLAGFLTHLATDPSPCGPADGQRLGNVLVDLITAWLAHHADATDQTPTETRQHMQFLEIQDFIHRHLGDVELSPATIAAAHHISLRSLHRLFHHHAHGATVASYIRRQRLTRARRDLADPSLVTRPVHAIAARWGFVRPADFTRAFRTTYGTTPTDYRHASLRAHPGIQR